MVASKTSQVPKLTGKHAVRGGRALARMMFWLALCVLIGAIAPVAVASPGSDSTPPQRLYARQTDGILVSDDTGTSWTRAGALPSRPLALAAARRTPGLVFVGTESLGLYRSNDGAASWQPVEGAVLAEADAAPYAVTALAINPEDEQIVYAASNVWLGTNTAHLTPLGVAVSVDGGRQWLQLSRAQLGDTPVQRLEPVTGQPLTVVTVNSMGSHMVSLALSPELLGLLQDADPAVRASAARAIGLIGDAAALPALMQTLGDTDVLVGQRVAEAIGRTGDRSVSAALLNALRSGPAAERGTAAVALGLLKSPEAVLGLAALLSAGDPGAQRVAAEALAAIGTPAAMAALMAPLADPQMTPARHAAMGGLEMASQSAAAPLVAALLDGNPVVRANAAEMLGWLQPIDDAGQRADAVAGLARLLSDPAPAVQTQAAWALREIDTDAARLALVSVPIPALNSAPILAPSAVRPVVPAPLVALPAAIAEIPKGPWPLGTAAGLLIIVLLAALAVVLLWKGPRPASGLGPT